MIRYLLYQLEYHRWLFFALLIALLIHLLPSPAPLSAEGKSVLAIVAMTIILVIFEPIALPVVAFLIVVLEVLFGIAPPAQVAQSFMSDAVIFIAGSLMLAVAIVKQELDKRILFFILRLTRTHVLWTVFSVVAFSALMASVMGEHAVAAVMLPVAVIMVRMARNFSGEPQATVSSVFLMSVAYGASSAAIGTPSGGARNAVMISYWASLAGVQVGYLDWVVLMYPLVLLQVPVVFFVLRRLYRPGSLNLTHAYGTLRRETGARRQWKTEDWVMISIMLITVVLWMTLSHQLGLGTIALVGVLMCIVTGVLSWDDINHDVNWGVVILFASIISIGLWMDRTGAAEWVAGGVQLLLGFLGIGEGPILLIAIGILSMMTGALLSSGPAIAILGPVVIQYAQLSGTNPLILGMVLVAAASYANFTPISSPACTIVYGSGMVNRREFFRVGFWFALVSFPLIILFAVFYWPLAARVI
jgi:solute carrier family 13 (sodium-dependent dicarboxylate transporter), member 2/3/5